MNKFSLFHRASIYIDTLHVVLFCEVEQRTVWKILLAPCSACFFCDEGESVAVLFENHFRRLSETVPGFSIDST